MNIHHAWRCLCAAVLFFTLSQPIAASAAKTSVPLKPVAAATVTSKFGYRKHPITHRHAFHNGLDLSATLNQSVKSVLDGIVTFVGRRGHLGNSVVVFHPREGVSSIYGHLNKVSVRRGQTLSAGNKVGAAGSTGRSTGVHLHLSIKDADGRYLNPVAFMRHPTRIARARFRQKNKQAVLVAGAVVAAKARSLVDIQTHQQLIASAREEYASAKKALEVYDYLYSEGAVSRNDLSSKKEQFHLAEQKLNQAEKGLS